MIKALAFDFDGVIIDSVNILRETYFEFLACYKRLGSESEFSSLNGPSLSEIINILMHRHNIDEAFESLKETYFALLEKNYTVSPLTDGLRDCLKLLKDLSIPLMIVTSSARNLVDIILDRHGISDSFSFIVTGEDVKESKPSPAIYLILKEKFKDYTFYVVEDSYNGLIAANSAGMKTIFFDPYGLGTDLPVFARVKSMHSLKSRILEIFWGSCSIEENNEIEVFVRDHSPSLSPETLRKVDDIWHSSLRTNNLVNERVLYYLNHVTQSNRCSIEAFWGPYKFFYARSIDPDLKIPFIPLSISGICSVDDEYFLVGTRGDVFEYRNALEFVPSGGISKSLFDGDIIDYTRQILEEFETETGIHKSNVSRITPLGLVLDLENAVVDICCSMSLRTAFMVNSRSENEYVQIQWLTMDEIEIDTFIPTSRSLFNLYLDSLEL